MWFIKLKIYLKSVAFTQHQEAFFMYIYNHTPSRLIVSLQVMYIQSFTPTWSTTSYWLLPDIQIFQSFLALWLGVWCPLLFAAVHCGLVVGEGLYSINTQCNSIIVEHWGLWQTYEWMNCDGEVCEWDSQVIRYSIKL